MPNFEPPKRDDSGPLGFKPSVSWLSPFSLELEPGQANLLGRFTIEYPRPRGWREIQSPREDSKVILFAPNGNGTLIIGAGFLPRELSRSEALENVAASPILNLLKHGAQIPVVMTIPTISSIEGVNASHMLNFLGTIPGNLVNSAEERVPLFKYTSVFGIGEHWISFETTSWGPGCNPGTEADLMGKLHLAVQIRRKPE